MSESPASPRDPPPTPREIKWDAVAAIIASLVGLLALIVAGYTAYIQRYTAHLQMEQVQAQVWPYLIGTDSNVSNNWTWTNKGVGPAVVKSVEAVVDGKPVPDWKAMERGMGIPPITAIMTFMDGNVVSAGETVDWIKFMNKTDYNSFMDGFARSKVDITVCYCSTLGECWTTRFKMTERHAVGECPALPESRQFHD